MIARLFCRWLGHRTVLDERGMPVIAAFLVCLRCGKWVRP